MKRAILIFCLAYSPSFASDVTPDEPTYIKPVFERPVTSESTRITGEADNARTPFLQNELGFIVDRLEQIQRICDAVDDEYTVDCLAVTYRALANALLNLGGNTVVQRTLENTASELESLVRTNLDPQKPALRAYLTNPKSGDRMLSTSQMRAVRAEQISTVKQQAMATLAEAETILLRSAVNSSKVSRLFQSVAAAVGSNKVLLRTA